MFEAPAALFSWFHSLSDSYLIAIALMAAVVMAITTPLTLKSTKGMLEMQRLAPEMRKLQNEHRNDRQKLNEEMMKLYQEHKVNPLASCLPIAAQMPIFLVMFRLLRGLVYQPTTGTKPIADATLRAFDRTDIDLGFIPRYLPADSELYGSLFGRSDMPTLGNFDLSKSAFDAIGEGLTTGIPYALLVVALGALYFGQQRMVAARAAMSPTMSPGQQKLMQYLPVFFAVFQIFFLSALVVYYIFQTLLRILQQYYITRKFYGHDESLGRQAQRASEQARDEAKKSGGGGMFAQAKRDLAAARGGGDDDDDVDRPAKHAKKKSGTGGTPRAVPTSKRVTPPKSRPTTNAKGRPTPSRKEAQAARSRPKSSGKKRR
ncbi:MAG: membrane protein insertase YidC [Ilumatobacter sp.]|nr:membrane protein insertase YidC [Ilumatobacter sp.]